MIRITVPGEPVPWSVHHRGDPAAARMKAWKNTIWWHAKSQYHGPRLTGPVRMSIVAYRAKGLPRSKAARADAMAGRLVPTTRPDATNLQKLAEDALQGICYEDDSQVVDVRTRKRYGDPPRLEIEVSAWEPDVC